MKVCGEGAYDVVKARSREEAVANCAWSVGDLAVVVEIVAMGNTDGTYTMYPLFGRVDEDEKQDIERAGIDG